MVWNMPRAITSYFNVSGGINVFMASQAPPGAGLGAARSATISLVKALSFWSGLDLGPAETADLASHIEIEEMGIPVGYFDHYATAFGGINTISVSRRGVKVEPINVSRETRAALDSGLMLFLADPSCQPLMMLHRYRASNHRAGRTEALQELTVQMREALQKGDTRRFGELMHQTWRHKRHLGEATTNAFLDRCYDLAREEGALGGMITTAGCGNFIVLYCPPERQPAVSEALSALGLRQQTMALEDNGVQVMQGIPWTRADTSVSMLSDQPQPVESRILIDFASRQGIEPAAYGPIS
jgi:D-glycero-alpha-D-manno-heptose-7-phosphate kinase